MSNAIAGTKQLRVTLTVRNRETGLPLTFTAVEDVEVLLRRPYSQPKALTSGVEVPAPGTVRVTLDAVTPGAYTLAVRATQVDPPGKFPAQFTFRVEDSLFANR